MNARNGGWAAPWLDGVLILATLGAAGWFGISGSQKLLEAESLRLALVTHGIVPQYARSWTATLLPAGEVALAVALVATLRRVPWLRWSWLFTISALACFCVYLGIVAANGGAKASCGCNKEAAHTVALALRTDIIGLIVAAPLWWYLLRRPIEWTTSQS